MKTTKLFILLVCITLLVSCKDQVLNATSYEVMNNSYQNILSSLSNEEKKPFSDAYNNIVFSYQNHASFRKKGDTREIIQKRLEEKIGGMNAHQIIKISESIEKKRLFWDIEELEKKIKKISKNSKELKLVTVKKSRFYVENNGGDNTKFLEIAIHNGTKYKITILDFLITIGSSTAGTILPKKGNFYVAFPDGLNSGRVLYKTINLGHVFSHASLPKEPILMEYSISRIGGREVDIDSNIHPTLKDLKKWLKLKSSKYEKKFGRKSASVIR